MTQGDERGLKMNKYVTPYFRTRFKIATFMFTYFRTKWPLQEMTKVKL